MHDGIAVFIASAQIGIYLPHDDLGLSLGDL